MQAVEDKEIAPERPESKIGLNSYLQLAAVFSGLALVVLGTLQKYLELSGGQIAGLGLKIHPLILLVPVIFIAAVSAVVAFYLLRWLVMTTWEGRWTILVTCLPALLFTVAFWYALRPQSAFLWSLRDDLAFLVSTWGVILLVFGLWRITPVPTRLPTTRWALLLALVFVVGCSAFAAGVILEAMPHMADAEDYVLEARMLWNGYLAFEAPVYPELFGTTGFVNSLAGFTGSYPIGWPLLLGFFYKLDLGWLANPVVAGLLVWVTYLICRDLADRQVAVVAALVMALTPWLAFSATSQLSHHASALWLLVFFYGYHRTLRSPGWWWPTIAGLALSAAILTRPSDAAFFAIPCIVYSLYLVATKPSEWLRNLIILGAFSMVGVIIYFGLNYYYKGDIFTSTYGQSFDQTLGNMGKKASSYGYFIWWHESMTAVNRWWFVGIFPIFIPVAVGLWWGRSRLKPAWLFLCSFASFSVCYGFLIFGSTTWFGPRWYVPLMPAVAYLVALGLVEAVRLASDGSRPVLAELSRAYLRSMVVVLLAVWLVVVPIMLAELSYAGPHGVDRRVLDAVAREDLSNAVVGLEYVGKIPGTDQETYKLPRTATWAMDVPFERSPVIYVVANPGWVEKSRSLWPDRQIYSMSSEPGVFDLIPVDAVDAAQ